ncbi:glycosyl transferase [Pseudoalteromonas luteoviolacea]|uniref:Glycosyl transferase n=1 Tax=Pseudoalteromonas luteoviolacea TaxID=43657 RepID=A0A0C1MLI9_9GAMM|nr:glycosyltransferase family 2 protein [Pseudoalteromonas luteoviolacea]KID57934.1 glycosyl transferase [Pseudoalteromonas luteoviolacea]
MPIVSVIMPSYNSEKTISESVQSVLSQSFDSWELIIVDDNSTDSTWEIIEELQGSNSKIRAFRNQENKGAGGSRNLAIDKASGRYIAFLDSDDIWAPEKLAEQIAFMQSNDYPFTYTYYQSFNSNRELGVTKAPDSISYNELLYSNVIGCLTAIYDSEYFGKRYMPLIRKRQDMGLWLELLSATPRAYCLTKNLAKYRVDSGMTASKTSVLSYQWRFYRDVVKLGFFKTICVFSVYALKGFIKNRKRYMD